MYPDHFFLMGGAHKVCEDYARSGFISDRAFALGGDGCSGAKDTDFGSRLLVRAAHNWLPSDYAIEPFCRSVAATAQTYARTLAMSSESLASTLLSLWQVGENIQARIMGDGVLAARDFNGYWYVLEFEFPDNAPYYLKYELNANNKFNFIASAQGGNETAEATVLRYSWAPGKLDKEPAIFQINRRMYVDKPFCFQKTWLPQFDIVLIASDGLSSFTDVNNKPVETWRVLNELLRFKGLKGEFIQRRCRRAFDRFAEIQWKNQDDVFVAGISNA